MGYDCDYVSDLQVMGLRSYIGKNGRRDIMTEAGVTYRALVIPEGTILPDNVKNRIETLKAQGITVIYGNDDAAFSQVARPEQLKRQHHLNLIRRKSGKGYCYFIANLTPNDVDAYCQVSKKFNNARWYDPLTNNYYAAETPNGKIRVTLRSGESMFLQLDCHKDNSQQLFMRPTAKVQESEINLDKGWKLSFIEESPKVNTSFKLNNLQTWEKLNNDSAKVTMGTGVYETTFKITSKIGRNYAINLGDVRESARVYINNKYIGCAWSVPYILSFNGSVLKKGINTIRIEVTNLPANRIADLDRKGVKWRKMEEINVVNIKYKNTKYDDWAPMPSGLNSTVKIYETKISNIIQ